MANELELMKLVAQVQLQKWYREQVVYRRYADRGAEGLLQGRKMVQVQRSMELRNERSFGPLYDQVLGLLGFWDPVSYSNLFHFHLYTSEAVQILSQLEGGVHSEEDVRNIVEKVFEDRYGAIMKINRRYKEIAEDIWGVMVNLPPEWRERYAPRS